MRNSIPLRALLVPLGFLIVAPSCSGVNEGGGFTVTYRTFMNGIGTIDSVRYGLGKVGNTVKVTAPAANWSLSVGNAAPGDSSRVILYGRGNATGGTVNLVRLWMTPEGVIDGDSTTVAAAPTTAFSIELPGMVLP